MGLLKKLLISLLIVFPLGVLIRIQVVPDAYVYPLDCLLLVTFLYTIYLGISKPQKLGVLDKSIVIFLGFCLLSLILNIWWLGFSHFVIASLYLIRLAMFISLVYAFRFTEISFRKKYVYWLFIAGLITVLLGFIQYVYYPNLRNLYYLGWDDHWYRMFSTFLDPNFAGAIFVLQSILTLFLLLEEKRHKLKIFFLCTLILSLIAVFLSYSRTAYMMMMFSVPIVLILLGKFKYLLLLLSFVVVGFLLIPKNLHSEGVDLLRTASIFSRVQSYQEGLRVFSSSPLYGVGFNTYRYAKERQGISSTSQFPDHAAAGVSNSFIFILATTGIVGLLLFLNIFRIIFQASAKELNGKRRALAFLVCTSTIAVLVGSLFENIIFYESIMFWYFAVLGIWNAGRKIID